MSVVFRRRRKVLVPRAALEAYKADSHWSSVHRPHPGNGKTSTSSVKTVLSVLSRRERERLSIDKINIPDCLVIIGLVTALIMAIFYNLNELAMSIASGLLGYIGGTVKSAVHQKGRRKIMKVFLNPGHAPNGNPAPGAVK